MENLPLAVLVIFHILFFWRNYTSWNMATGELLSTFFPSWVYIGRRMRQGKSWTTDKHYWLNFHAHPVLSSYYPPHVITAYIGSFLSLDKAFKLLTANLLLHHLFMSIGWFLFFGGNSTALFCALGISYCAYFLKQQTCLIYTISWIPWFYYGLTHSLLLASIACGMALLGGYLPIAIYLIPMGLLLSPMAIIPLAIGALIASPQLIPFLRYRSKCHKPDKNVSVGPTEYNFFFGFTPIIILLTHFKLYYIELFIPIIASILFKKYLPRIPMRAWVISLVGFFMFLCQTHIGTVLSFLLCLELWIFNRVLPPPNYSELYSRPSWAFNTRLTRFLEQYKDTRTSGLPFPLFTGHINNLLTMGYCGCMQNKLMFNFRKDDQHDWFKNHEDSEQLERYRVRFAFSRKKISGWKSTTVRNLWENPRLS